LRSSTRAGGLGGRLLITADAGGSNGYRVRAWKTELARLAAETGLQITVCHLPPGTSKGNRIEPRLFSAISMNWRGRPLVSHEVIVELIGRPRPPRACGSAPSWTAADTAWRQGARPGAGGSAADAARVPR
jgi:hypothetical protein